MGVTDTVWRMFLILVFVLVASNLVVSVLILLGVVALSLLSGTWAVVPLLLLGVNFAVSLVITYAVYKLLQR